MHLNMLQKSDNEYDYFISEIRVNYHKTFVQELLHSKNE